MRRFFLLFLIFSASYSFGQSVEVLDKAFGYKDLEFGTPKEELVNLIYSCTPFGHCLLNGEQYERISHVPLETIWMRFNENNLSAVLFRVSGKSNVEDLLSIYKSTYGKPTEIKAAQKKFYWEGTTVNLSYEIDESREGNVNAKVVIAAKGNTANN